MELNDTRASRQLPKRSRKTKAAPPVDKPGLPARRVAVRLLGAIIDARTPMDALTDDAHGHPQYLALAVNDRSLVRAIVMAALRHRADLSAIIDAFIDKPLPPNATALRHILHVALSQILILDIPDHSAVDLAVESAHADPRSRRFGPLVNALTRRAVRSKIKLKAQLAQAPVFGPDWFTAMLMQAYGQNRAQTICEMIRHEAPIDIAIRRNTISAEEFAQLAGGVVLHERAVRLPTGSEAGRAIPTLPGFAEGHIWVQDVGAGIPAALLGNVSGKRVLDACAAPGGKTAQLLDAGARVTALDISANRLKRLRTNLERLKLNTDCETVAKSLFDYQTEDRFDAVLLDAPCSSTGTIRRHPDVGWVKSDADIVKLADLQARMLTYVTDLVKPGGKIVFANCSLDPREGEAMVDRVLSQHRKLALEPVDDGEIPWLEGAITPHGAVRTTPDMLGHLEPGLAGMDGFFAARLVRTS